MSQQLDYSEDAVAVSSSRAPTNSLPPKEHETRSDETIAFRRINEDGWNQEFYDTIKEKLFQEFRESVYTHGSRNVLPGDVHTGEQPLPGHTARDTATTTTKPGIARDVSRAPTSSNPGKRASRGNGGPRFKYRAPEMERRDSPPRSNRSSTTERRDSPPTKTRRRADVDSISLHPDEEDAARYGNRPRQAPSATSSFIQRRMERGLSDEEHEGSEMVVSHGRAPSPQPPNPVHSFQAPNPPVQVLDIEQEIFNQVDVERYKDEEDMDPEISTNLASRVKEYYGTVSGEYKARKFIYDRYKTPANLSSIRAPDMNPEVRKYQSFTPYHQRMDTDFQDLQFLVNKGMQVMVDLADKAIKAEKDDKILGSKAVILNTLHAATLFGHVQTKLNQKRRNNVRSCLAEDIRSICDENRPEPTKYLFGDDYQKLIKETREKHNSLRAGEGRMERAKPYQPPNRPQQTRSDNFRRNQQRDQEYKGGYTKYPRNNKSFLGRGKSKSRPPRGNYNRGYYKK